MYSLLGLLILILDVIAVVSLISGTGSVGHKVFWTILILILPMLGMILYFLIGRSSADAPISE